MSADAIVATCLKDIPKSVAAGVCDLDSGQVISMKTVDSHPRAVLELLAPATKDLFEGKIVLEIEQQFKKARGVTDDDHYFQELLVGSTHLWHYFGRLKSNPRAVIAVVTKGDINLGTLLVTARKIRDEAQA